LGAAKKKSLTDRRSNTGSENEVRREQLGSALGVVGIKAKRLGERGQWGKGRGHLKRRAGPVDREEKKEKRTKNAKVRREMEKVLL